MPIRAGKTKIPANASANMSMPNSQASSDDNMLELVVAEKYLVQVEKKNKGGQAKCIESLKRSIAESINLPTEELKKSVEQTNEKYNTFILAYAKNEDKIRKILVEIQSERGKMQKIVDKMLETRKRTQSEVEKLQIRALGLVKAAIRDQEEITASILGSD